MTRTVELGAPSLTGKDANDLVAEVFADAKYPLKVLVVNRMPRNVSFPEIDGLFLRNVANPKESQKVVTIPNADAFQRLASSVEQVAELNKYQVALVISEAAESDAKSTKTATVKTGKQATAPADTAETN